MGQEEASSSVTSSSLQYFSLMSPSPTLGGSPHPWLRSLKPEERGLCLIHLLLACAKHVAAGSTEDANIGLECISHLASPDGDTMQRIAAYFTEALADRLLKGWQPGLHRALNATKISSFSDEFLAKRLFFELFPFLKMSYLLTNQAIMEAMEGEKMVHVIDLHCFEPPQWINLLQAFSSRRGGPPHVRITGIHEQKEVLDHMALYLNKEAEKLDIPFQFNPVVSKLENIDVQSLRVKTGEALAVSSVLQLHSLLAFEDDAVPTDLSSSKDAAKVYSSGSDSASSALSLCNNSMNNNNNNNSSSKFARFLTALWGLSPKLMVLTEQESNHNGSSLMDRLMEALNFYAALFDCLESTLPRASRDRKQVEKMLFGEEIKNIVAYEGAERRKRHEKLDRWAQRLESVGFRKVPLSYHGALLARTFLQSNGSCDGYRIREENGYLFMCWQERPMYSVSAWSCRRYD